MLSGFGTTAGERTLPHFDDLFARVCSVFCVLCVWEEGGGGAQYWPVYPPGTPRFFFLLQAGLKRTSVTSVRGYYYVIVAEPVAGWAPAAPPA